MVLFSGFLGKEQQAIQLLIMNCNSFAYIFSIGLSNASAAIIGQELGKGNLVEAKT